MENEILHSERLLLRRWEESDAEELFKIASDPDVGPRAGWEVHRSVEESREVIRRIFSNEATWAIVWKETNHIVGCIGYFANATSNGVSAVVIATIRLPIRNKRL